MEPSDNYLIPFYVEPGNMAFSRLNAVLSDDSTGCFLLMPVTSIAGCGAQSGWDGLSALSLTTPAAAKWLDLECVVLGGSSIFGGIQLMPPS